MKITKEELKKGLNIVIVVFITSAISVFVKDYYKKHYKEKEDAKIISQCNSWAAEQTLRVLVETKINPEKAEKIKTVLKEICIEDLRDQKRNLSKEELEAKKLKNAEKIYSVILEAKFSDMYEKNNPKENKSGEYKIVPICRLTDEGDKSFPLCKDISPHTRSSYHE